MLALSSLATTPASPDDTDAAEALLWPGRAERERARAYHRLRRRIALAAVAVQLAERGLFLGSGGPGRLESALAARLPKPWLVAPSYAAVVGSVSSTIELPLAWFGGYRVERRYAMTNQPAADWLRQRLLGTALSLGVQMAVTTLLHHLLRRRPDDWWRFVLAATLPATVALSTAGPLVIMPLFNRFTPLADKQLVERIKALGERTGVHVADVYEMNMSRQTERANAMFTGIGRTKRIVIGDTMLRDFTSEEIEGVLAHEFGHQVNHDIWRLSLAGAATIAGIVVATDRLARPALAVTARWTGIRRPDQVGATSVLGAVASAAGALLALPAAHMSRQIERRTDRFAMIQTGQPTVYAGAIARLGRQNLVDPAPPRWWERLTASHPPVLERIRTALAAARQD